MFQKKNKKNNTSPFLWCCSKKTRALLFFKNGSFKVRFQKHRGVVMLLAEEPLCCSSCSSSETQKNPKNRSVVLLLLKHRRTPRTALLLAEEPPCCYLSFCCSLFLCSVVTCRSVVRCFFFLLCCYLPFWCSLKNRSLFRASVCFFVCKNGSFRAKRTMVRFWRTALLFGSRRTPKEEPLFVWRMVAHGAFQKNPKKTLAASRVFQKQSFLPILERRNTKQKLTTNN